MSLQLKAAGVRGRIGWRLQPMDLTLEAGSVHAVLGANGAGKSTLLHLLAGDLVPTTGSVTLDRQPLTQWRPESLARRRAVYGQNEQLHFGYTVLESVQLGSLPWVVSDEINRVLAQRALEWVDAATLSQRSVLTLSGGQQARVRFARVLVQLWSAPECPPCYLLLDEPTAHLDFTFQHRALAIIRRLARAGTGVLLTLHDPNLALRYADQVTLLACGKVIGQGGVSSVLSAASLTSAYGMRIMRDDTRQDYPTVRVALDPELSDYIG